MTIKARPILEKTTAQFVDSLESAGNPPIYSLPVEQARQVLREAQEGHIHVEPVDITDTFIKTDTQNISVRIMRPRGNMELLPGVMYLHGGGWILGDKETHDRLIREITVGSSVALVFVNYTPSPEAQFPTALEQAYNVLTHLHTHGKELHIDGSRLAVIGDSAGGNIAAALTLLAKERKGPHLTAQVLLYPVTNADFTTPSYIEFAQGPWLTRAAMQWFWDAYCPDIAKRSHHLVSPLQATVAQLKELPTALIITDENDVLRDEGEAYAHKLMEAGVPVTAFRLLGTCHDFAMLNALAKTPATVYAIETVNNTLKKAFTK